MDKVHAVEAGWDKYAQRTFPDDKVWDKFIEVANCPTYHYKDYEFMSKYTLPDWSHLSAEDAKLYTKKMVNQLIEDNHLTKKTN